MAQKAAKNHARPQTQLAHGAAELPTVIVDTYNAELRSAEGFLGDRASKRAFQAIIDDWRDRMRKVDEDPLGDTPTEELSKKTLDKLLTSGDAEAAALVQGAVEEFAKELATVARRFLRLKSWQYTQCIVVGGGFRDSRIGELVIGRASVMLKGEGTGIELRPIRHDPDEAGLIGAAHLAPAWVFAGHDGIVGVDIGGSNFRVGLVEIESKKKGDLADASVLKSEQWRHGDEEPGRGEAIERLIDMLQGMIRRAKKDKFKLAPFIGIGCPGIIRGDGSIERGGQNLPGNWESSRFNLAQCIREHIPKLDGHQPAIVIHNDAVVQGLSEAPFMREVEHWGVLTIGTGLGNARFTNRPSD